MGNRCLVTGAGGHLGNNLVRELLGRGETVRAGIRNEQHGGRLAELDCEIVHADMLDIDAMREAMAGVDVLYHVAAVFRHWAKDPAAEIITPNIQGTEIILRAAAEAGVRKVVYVSSVAAVGHNGQPLDETVWNTLSDNAYYNSKILSEQRAWELAKEFNLNLVTVLPSAMIGPHAGRLTDTMQFIEDIRLKQVPVDPGFYFNFVDVRDVAAGIAEAAGKGRPGQRYILANHHASSVSEIIGAARQSGLNLKGLPGLPKWLLWVAASMMEFQSKLTGRPADLLRSQVRLFFGVRQEYNSHKAMEELGFNPRKPEVALSEVFSYLEARAGIE